MMRLKYRQSKAASVVLKIVILALALLAPAPALAERFLYMAEEDGCFWCAKWNTEIAHIYPKTIEGRTAPLKRFDVHDTPPDVTFAKRVHFTPTFILVEDGQEKARLEGYPGEDFFWGLLTMMFAQAGIDLEEAS